MENTTEKTQDIIIEIPDLTEEEWAEIERARLMPITFDEDCPETTPEQAVRFRRVNPVMQPVN